MDFLDPFACASLTLSRFTYNTPYVWPSTSTLAKRARRATICWYSIFTDVCSIWRCIVRFCHMRMAKKSIGFFSCRWCLNIFYIFLMYDILLTRCHKARRHSTADCEFSSLEWPKKNTDSRHSLHTQTIEKFTHSILLSTIYIDIYLWGGRGTECGCEAARGRERERPKSAN